MKHITKRYSLRKNGPNQLVTDYIASMTDDYFVDLYSCLLMIGCK
ncbi:MAG: hypothetical protein ACLR56_01780 [Oscillospiraceae bacterium]